MTDIEGCPEVAYWGLAGDYVEIMAPSTEAPLEFHLAAALTLTGLIAGTLWVPMGPALVHPTLYTVLVGGPGSKKTTAIGAAIRHLDPGAGDTYSSTAGWHSVTGAGSREGLLEAIGRGEGKPTLLRLPEFAGVVRKMKSKATATLAQLFLELYDHPPVIENHTRSAPIVVKNPSVSILADATPEPLIAELQNSDVASGLISRTTFWSGNRGEPNPYPDPPDPAEAAKLNDNVQQLADFAREPHSLDVKPDAKDWWEGIYRGVVYEIQNVHDANARLGDQAWQLASIYTFTDRRRIITLEDLKRGWQVANWLSKVRLELVKDIGKSTKVKLLDRITEIVNAAGYEGITIGKIPAQLSTAQRASADNYGMARLVYQLVDDARITSREDRYRPAEAHR